MLQAPLPTLSQRFQQGQRRLAKLRRPFLHAFVTAALIGWSCCPVAECASLLGALQARCLC